MQCVRKRLAMPSTSRRGRTAQHHVKGNEDVFEFYIRTLKTPCPACWLAALRAVGLAAHRDQSNSDLRSVATKASLWPENRV